MVEFTMYYKMNTVYICTVLGKFIKRFLLVNTKFIKDNVYYDITYRILDLYYNG